MYYYFFFSFGVLGIGGGEGFMCMSISVEGSTPEGFDEIYDIS